jgi:hypothetical protein
MKGYSWIFKSMVKRERRAHKKEYMLHSIFYVASFFFTLIGGLIMLSFIWWPLKESWVCISVWEATLSIMLLTYLLLKLI